jgi:hypothetical protein
MIRKQSQKLSIPDEEYLLKKFPNSESDYPNIVVALEDTCVLKPETPVNMGTNTSAVNSAWKPTATWPMSGER